VPAGSRFAQHLVELRHGGRRPRAPGAERLAQDRGKYRIGAASSRTQPLDHQVEQSGARVGVGDDGPDARQAGGECRVPADASLE
jgi:hypothetical protein